MEEGEGGNAGLEKREGKGRRRRGIRKEGGRRCRGGWKRVVGGAEGYRKEGGRRCIGRWKRVVGGAEVDGRGW